IQCPVQALGRQAPMGASREVLDGDSAGHYRHAKPSSVLESQELRCVGMLKIGEVSARSGLSVKALRYYGDIGIVRPHRRTRSGYRLYNPDVLKHLAFVRSAQALGLSLGEIREVIAMRDRGEAPCSHVLALIQRRAEELDERIVELQGL